MRTPRPLPLVIIGLLAVVVVGCGGAAARSPSAAARSASHNVIPPEPVLQTVFDVARGGEVAKLTDLCDPTGRNDQDTQDICDLADDDSGLDKFRHDFAKGAIRNTDVTGSKATIDFTYGPDGGKNGKMTLVQRDEKWYLSGF